MIEQFKSDLGGWQTSSATKKEDDKEEEVRYDGAWEVRKPYVYPGLEGDHGLVALSEAKHHAISYRLPEPFVNDDKTLVLQYEVKLQDGLDCGGAYIKLLTAGKESVEFKEFDDKTPYTIMFGPDRCGFTDKVHLIYRQKDSKSEEMREHQLSEPPSVVNDKLSNLYTLIVRPNDEFEILVNRKQVKKGSLLEDFYPRLNPVKMIDDVNDSMPSDWVTEPRIPDPEAKKPADWDEDAPYEIPDPEKQKPSDWLDNEPLEVADPDAEKPEDWDEEEDGEWIPPMVSNPKCEEVSGCGEWVQPKIRNPKYKGKWYAPQISNPDYKGPWLPGKAENPDYYENRDPSDFDPIVTFVY